MRLLKSDSGNVAAIVIIVIITLISLLFIYPLLVGVCLIIIQVLPKIFGVIGIGIVIVIGVVIIGVVNDHVFPPKEERTVNAFSRQKSEFLYDMRPNKFQSDSEIEKYRKELLDFKGTGEITRLQSTYTSDIIELANLKFEKIVGPFGHDNFFPCETAQVSKKLNRIMTNIDEKFKSGKTIEALKYIESQLVKNHFDNYLKRNIVDGYYILLSKAVTSNPPSDKPVKEFYTTTELGKELGWLSEKGGVNFVSMMIAHFNLKQDPQFCQNKKGVFYYTPKCLEFFNEKNMDLKKVKTFLKENVKLWA